AVYRLVIMKKLDAGRLARILRIKDCRHFRFWYLIRGKLSHYNIALESKNTSVRNNGLQVGRLRIRNLAQQVALNGIIHKLNNVVEEKTLARHLAQRRQC